MSRVSLIAAKGLNNEIGQEGKLPWSLSGDLKRFKEITTGHPILMGRKTFQSIGKPLPKRTNIVISADRTFQAEGVIVVPSFERGLETAGPFGDELFVIGGSRVFAEALPYCQRLYLTTVQGVFPQADVFFPTLDTQEWKILDQEDFPADEKNSHRCIVQTWSR